MTTSTITNIPLPEPFSSIPRHPLTLYPSPIHALPRITAALATTPTPSSPGATIYAKREDLTSALASGGNKTRKLEYLLPDALAQNATTLISIGGIQSNHTRQVAAAAAVVGLKARTIQEDWVPWSDAGYARVGNIQLSRLMGADVRLDPSGFGIEHKETLRRLQAECDAHGERTYYIPAGASDHPLGGVGFARWAFEVREQEREMGVVFGTVIVCVVTGSTLAGMIAGFKLLEKLYPHEPTRRVLGIDASAKPQQTRQQVLRIAKMTAVKIGLREDDVTLDDVELNEDYHAGVYGVPDKRTWEAIEFAARTEAFITDPVYEGKSFAGLMDLVRRGEVSGNVLFAHLGGQLALNAYSEVGAVKE
ncbi:putative 1-aminocyclopropane-1-carboxylate deaminase [Aspergillus heteromorphus CBS 117.55]|uniref:Putative 1-aminocyclopropane-1-carboxylate deaminase n=1 Tax=Aspergillus heteromorphus CBS 117.55 TaxID=1448321 RepID=A0A317VT26_9EURO|nr:putative 1-aminocyclopropane-1-carboxylate deaminase [Aspergillus heteromorphus CBS 117.55]PWY75080.1 putative 1-aminocyclopropane-1-carboxylate deaminase [Aspergillus heteromorphus CBS 117.55]